MSTEPLVPEEERVAHEVRCLDCGRRFPSYPDYRYHYCPDRDGVSTGVAFA
jgi:hypothetical protein